MLWYCDSIVAQNIRSLTAYHDKDWKTLAKIRTDEYAEGDEVQVMYSMEYLERLKGLDRSENDDLDLYCQQHKAISNELISKGHFRREDSMPVGFTRPASHGATGIVFPI